MKFKVFIAFLAIMLFNIVTSLNLNAKIASDKLNMLSKIKERKKSSDQHTNKILSIIRATCGKMQQIGGQQLCEETHRRNKNGLCKWNGNSCQSMV